MSSAGASAVSFHTLEFFKRFPSPFYDKYLQISCANFFSVELNHQREKNVFTFPS